MNTELHEEDAAALGIRLGREGEHEEALRTLQQVQTSDNPDIRFQMGESLAALGRWPEAVNHFARAVQLRPDDATALTGLGNALFSCGRKLEAVAPLRAARASRPHDATINYLLGTSLIGTAHEDEASQCLEQAYRASGHPRAANNYAAVLARLGRRQDAFFVLDQLLTCHPDYARGWDTLGTVHLQMKQFDAARVALERAIELDPENPEPYVRIVNCLLVREQVDEVFEFLQRALDRGADSVDLLSKVAGQFERLQMPEAAMALHRHVLKIEPDDVLASSRLLHLGLESCDWQHYDDVIGRTLEQVDADIAADRPLSYVLFNLFALPVDNDLILRAARHQARCVSRHVGADNAPPFVHGPRGRDRIRIGYVLPYTHFSSMPLVMCDLVENHDRGRFEVFGYTLEPPLDQDFSRRFRKAFDTIVDVPESSPLSAARRVHEDEIDILIDVTGHTPTSCLPILAFRPAPLQVHAVGYSLTCGADYVDYLVSTPGFIPEDWGAYCHEALAYLPDVFMPSFPKPAASVRVTRNKYDLPDDGVVFVNFNDSYKFDPAMFATWLRILTRVPGSVLWLGNWSSLAVTNLRQEAERQGVAPERIVFAKVVEHEEHAARLELADIALDNQYHGGGVTSTDALSAGLPLLTVHGRTPAARLGTVLCTAAGVPELVTDDLHAYEELAVALATDTTRRHALRKRLRDGRETSALFDRERYREHLEAAYVTMWQRHQNGLPPETFHVPTLI